MIPSKIGRYEIKSELGRGGMATVYRAHDPSFKRDVALKVLPREFLHDPTFRARFVREAETIASLEHPAIVPVYDFGEEDGQPYLVMRLMTGGSLADRIKKGPLPITEAVAILQHLGPALDEAHSKGIIHRDLKPGNILFDQRGDPAIADFGIAKLAQASSNLSRSQIIGTPAYMSPEQATSDAEIDGRSDIYTLGAILFEMLTGKLPYEADTPIGMAIKHIQAPVPRILDTNPNLPPGCQTVIDRAMAKQRDERYAMASEMATALEAASLGVASPPIHAIAETVVTLPEPQTQLAQKDRTVKADPLNVRHSMNYLDFELAIGSGKGREYPVAVVRSPAGETSATMHFPFSDLELTDHLKDLRIALLSSGGQHRTMLTAEEQAVQDFGQELFEALFAGEVRSRYDVSREQAWKENQGLRLKLRIQSPELAALPWELLYDSRNAEYVCLSRKTPIVRYPELPQAIQPLVVTPPLRILGMIASPGDLHPLNVKKEKQRVEQALRSLRTQGLVDVSWLEGQTSHDLQHEMQGGPWHIFHFIGHGGFDHNTGEGFIALADEMNKIHRLNATQLGRLLADHQSLRMVLLNSCEGAKSSERDIFSSAAAILIRRGIPAVLAMQYAITDQAAIELARAFYEALANGLPADAAVVEARKAISLTVPNTLEWGTPVLYMRSPDGGLFNVQRQKPDPKAYQVPKPKREKKRPVIPIIRFSSGKQVHSVEEWVDLAERNWPEATEFLYNGSLEKWLVHINRPDLAHEAERIKREVTDDHSIGLEQFQRIAGSFNRQRKAEAVTNLDDLMGRLAYWKVRGRKAPLTLTMEIKNQGRGYLHGRVVSKIAWIEISQPRFGCLPGAVDKVDIVIHPARRKPWELSLSPLDFELE